MKVTLVEPWMGGSHRQWAEGFAAASSHRVHLVGLPANGWRWRLRASALRLAELVVADAKRGGVPDVLVVSGLTDTASLLGLLPFRVPTVTFMHESQIAYPSGRSGLRDGITVPARTGLETQTGLDIESAVINLRSWLASDEVWFNSSFHQETVSNALLALRANVPADLWPEGDPTERFVTMGLGVDLDWVDLDWVEAVPDRSPGTRPPTIVWTHRWEQDKNPEVFLAALKRLDGTGLGYRLVLAGEDGVKPHPAKAEIQRLGAGDCAVGPFSVAEYRAHLLAADLVVSCASHEFFGVGVVEAVAARCLPVLPRSLSYPEVIPERFHHAVLYEPGRFGTALEAAVRSVPCSAKVAGAPLAQAMQDHSWNEVAPRYDQALIRLAGDSPPQKR